MVPDTLEPDEKEEVTVQSEKKNIEPLLITDTIPTGFQETEKETMIIEESFVVTDTMPVTLPVLIPDTVPVVEETIKINETLGEVDPKETISIADTQMEEETQIVKMDDKKNEEKNLENITEPNNEEKSSEKIEEGKILHDIKSSGVPNEENCETSSEKLIEAIEVKEKVTKIIVREEIEPKKVEKSNDAQCIDTTREHILTMDDESIIINDDEEEDIEALKLLPKFIDEDSNSEILVESNLLDNSTCEKPKREEVVLSQSDFLSQKKEIESKKQEEEEAPVKGRRGRPARTAKSPIKAVKSVAPSTSSNDATTDKNTRRSTRLSIVSNHLTKDYVLTPKRGARTSKPQPEPVKVVTEVTEPKQEVAKETVENDKENLETEINNEPKEQALLKVEENKEEPEKDKLEKGKVTRRASLRAKNTASNSPHIVKGKRASKLKDDLKEKPMEEEQSPNKKRKLAGEQEEAGTLETEKLEEIKEENKIETVVKHDEDHVPEEG